MQSIRRGFLQQGESLAAVRMLDRIDTLQAFRELSFGMKLRDYSANRNLFPRPRRRRKDTPR